METIIKKAIEGGWNPNQKAQFILFNKNINDSSVDDQAMKVQIGDQWSLDSLFWQALGRACGWKKPKVKVEFQFENGYNYTNTGSSVCYALHFHEINLTEGWEKAVEYLKEITN